MALRTLKGTLLLVAVLGAAPSARAVPPIELGEGSSVLFATVDEAKGVLAVRDDYVRRLSPFDRAAKMKSGEEVSEEDYLAFVGRNVLAWEEADRKKVRSAFDEVLERIRDLALPFPEKVLLIKTTGKTEGQAPYTRSNAIVLPKGNITAPVAQLRRILCHELFHVLSRNNPEMQERLYAMIGFVKCDELTFPDELKARKITNPDAPINDHCIRLEIDGKQHWAIPILYSKAEKYDVERGGEFFAYLQFRLLLVAREPPSPAVAAIYDGEQPRLVDVNEVTGFYEQVGRNTNYIIHPEEILAENFVHLVLKKQDLPSPEIIEKMKRILKSP